MHLPPTFRFEDSERCLLLPLPSEESRAEPVVMLVFLGMTALLAATGQMRPWISPDTASWLHPCDLSGCWAGPRTPAYALVYAVLSTTGCADALLPWLQLAAILAATLWLMRGARGLHVSRRAQVAVGVALVTSNMVVLWARAELPELLAHAAMVGAVGSVLHQVRRRSTPGLLGAGGLAGAAYLLKPGFLLFIPLLPILQLALAAGAGRFKAAASLLAAIAVPFVLAAGWRLATLDSFNVVSFGGYGGADADARHHTGRR